MPFGIQPIHLVIVVVVALIIFGPQRLPEIGRGLGKSINEFRKGAKEMTEGFRDEVISENAAATSAPPAAVPTVNCPSCNAANPSGAAFCSKCGTKLAYQ
jgi:sec-independent protein translocase protein TatA